MDRKLDRTIFVVALIALLSYVSCPVQSVKDSFGSKTPYTFSEPFPGEDGGEREDNLAKKCPASALFMVTRHGSRFPTAKHLKKFDKLRQKLGGNWSHDFQLKDEGLLTALGESEMRELGRRTRARFADLFAQSPEYHPRRYEFKSSKALRAMQSASAFAFGMFGPSRSFAIENESLDRDYLLRFHDNCPGYMQNKKVSTPKLDHLLLDIAHNVGKRVKATKSVGGDEDFDFFLLYACCGVPVCLNPPSLTLWTSPAGSSPSPKPSC